METVAKLLIAGAGFAFSAASCAADANSMLECAAFYDAAAATVRGRPDLANTQFLVGNPGRAALLLFSSGTQMSGVQAAWIKYSAMQKSMLFLLQRDAAEFARVVFKYESQCIGIVAQLDKTRA